MVVNLFRFFPTLTLLEIERMTLYEYNLRFKSVNLRKVDEDYKIHWSAWCNWNVQAKKQQGKNKVTPVYTNFKKFFDYAKELKKVMGTTISEFSDKRKNNIIEALKRQEVQQSED